MPVKKKAPQKAKKSAASKKKTAIKKAAGKKVPPAKKTAARPKGVVKKKAPAKKSVVTRTPVGRAGDEDNALYPRDGGRSRSGGQSGDLQGLSDTAVADSESVDELLEEGNSLEAEVVHGVEDVPDADEGEVHTHEVPEDDVPEEYLDKDE